ncbi:uncharacterized protein LOC135204613 [Macrobrachium nipponense]|uniref:uncharacterized protein LOC135204613 n=1 Tax=Macrobrachium nipponense TaxID=159736 RepID=UPI0030C7B457
MEWANGDIRCHFPRSHPSFSSSSIQETVVDFHGYTPPPGGQTRLLDYGGSDVVPPGSGRLQECTPNHCGGGGGGGGGASYPPTATLTYGITHPNYQITTKSISTHAPSGVYSTDRGPAAGVYMPPPPSRVVGDYAPSYPSAAHQQQQQQSYPGSQSSPPYHSESEHQRAAAAYVGGSCSECPVSATCDYSGVGVGGGTHHHLQHHPSMPPTSCGYPLSSDECHVVRTDLGPLPDIHPEIRSTTSGGIVGDMRHHPHPHHHPSSSSSSSYHHIHHTPPPPPPPQQQQQQGGEMRDDLLRPECYDGGGGGGVGGGLRSHHASHCDLREFEEWREMRGSRESVGTLPPELETHLKQCRCPCDHLGYGNYQSLVDGRVSHISRSHSSCSVDTCRHDPPTVYTQLSYLDSPRSTSSNGFTHRRKAVGGELGTRHWWLVGLVFLVAVTAGVGVGVPLALRGDPKQSLDKRLEIARKILSEYPLIDGHNDLPWNIRSFIHNQLEKLKLNESLKLIEPWSKSNWSHTDLPRLLQEGTRSGSGSPIRPVTHST